LAYRKTDCNFPPETRKTKAFESVFDNLLIMAVKKALKTNIVLNKIEKKKKEVVTKAENNYLSSE